MKIHLNNKLSRWQKKNTITDLDCDNLQVDRGVAEWAALTHSNVLVWCTVLTDSASPRKRHVHERATSGNTNWEPVATAWAYSTPAA